MGEGSMIKWVQCSDCKGLGKTKEDKACLRCKGKLCVSVDTVSNDTEPVDTNDTEPNE